MHVHVSLVSLCVVVFCECLTRCLQAAKRTAEIRNEVEESLRQLREKFQEVENVVALYADDKDVVEAAMNVLVSVLQALEDIVLYYSAKRGNNHFCPVYYYNGCVVVWVLMESGQVS